MREAEPQSQTEQNDLLSGQSVDATSTAEENSALPSPVTGIAVPTIMNQKVPLVVFVGPASSGKSMILVRLAKYLRDQGYTIDTDTTFLNTPEYQQDCAEFKNKLNTTVALDGSVKFLLVDVYNKSTLVAKLLEAPGEDFYTTDPEKQKSGKNSGVAPYLATIMASTNPKIYVVMLDLDSEHSFRKDGSNRDAYAQRFLDDFYPKINYKRDRIVLLYNKIDVTHFGTINGCHDLTGARKDAEMYYKSLFSTMKISKWVFFTLDNFVFKTFCTGIFADVKDNLGNSYQTYNVAGDVYPCELWNEITKRWL